MQKVMSAPKVVAVGGMGGSGTRALCRILMQSGINMGSELNEELDNLLFTRLFKDPDYFRSSDEVQRQKRFRIFRQLSEEGRIDVWRLWELIKAGRSNPFIPYTAQWRADMIRKSLKSKSVLPLWGWKEPNTQLYLEEIDHFFPNLKYIHVLRNGLDMAYSINHSQLENWGWIYDLEYTGRESEKELAVKQLDFWIRSTKEVSKYADKMNDRFLLIKHENLTDDAGNEIRRLLDFLELEYNEELLNSLAKIPQRPSSRDRYKAHGLEHFRQDQLESISDLGYQVEM